MKIRPWGAELFRADGQTWRRQQSISGRLRTRLKTSSVSEWWTGGVALKKRTWIQIF